MSAVAITLAELAVEAMHDASATHAMVDNGGDVALINDYGLKRRVTKSFAKVACKKFVLLLNISSLPYNIVLFGSVYVWKSSDTEGWLYVK